MNPRHLRWATRRENHADKKIHGTHNSGARNGGAKITEGVAREIPSMRGKASLADLVAIYGISKQQISAIHTGRKWPCLRG
jgi:hypothetical protein